MTPACGPHPCRPCPAEAGGGMQEVFCPEISQAGAELMAFDDHGLPPCLMGGLRSQRLPQEAIQGCCPPAARHRTDRRGGAAVRAAADMVE